MNDDETLPHPDHDEAAMPAEPPTVKIGRYQLLELVGVGGMGMVWGAWDPELERRVALKLVKRTTAGSRDRILREGQVLAQLSHPNIVPIFDVGVMGDQVYLVMEWVRGTSLRAYSADKPPARELLAAFVQAGHGLAAAHAAGVIHRDFKPDNAIRGDDERVRVLDFGIAHDGATPSTPATSGTPHYMAPEQKRGEVTAACDQYAFCASLREALGPALPSWIEPIVERGTDANPERRFASMDALLVALGHDPARRRRRVAFGVGAVALAVGTFAIGRSGSSNRATIEPCTGGASELAASWNPPRRERVLAHLRTLPRLAAGEADRIIRTLDDYGTAWIDEHRRTCLANERKELTLPRHEARLGCLVRTRTQLEAAGELLGAVAAADLAPAVLAASSLPDVHGCADSTALVPPPANVAGRVKAIAPKIERLLVRAIARSVDAIGEAKLVTAEARATGYDPLVARALLVEGRAALVSTDARAQFAEAMQLALRSSDDVLAVEAYARWIFELVHNTPDGNVRIDNWTVMTEVAGRLGSAGRFARALMYNNHGTARVAAGDKGGAHALFDKAAVEAGDAPEIELVAIQKNLALLESDPIAAARRMRAAYERHAAVLGPSHPDVLESVLPLAQLEPDRARSRAELERACEGFARWQQADRFRICVYEAALLAIDDGDRDAALRWFGQVVADDGDIKDEIAATYAAIANNAPDRDRRVEQLERLATPARGEQPAWWVRRDHADALVVLAQLDPRLWERVMAILEPIDRTTFARRRARAQRMLAIQWATSRPADAKRLATLALAWYRRAPGDRAIVDELERIVAS